jgi:rod shape-determining protein MreD
MAMSASLARRELDVQRYPLAVVILVPLLAIFLQSLIPRFIPRFDIIDLPLLVTIYFSVGWRNPIAGTVTGAIIGLIQDALTSRPLGINGISQCVVGFLAASMGVKIDVENPGTRLLINFAFTLLNIGIYLFIVHHMLAFHVKTNWLHEAIKAVINSIVGVFFFDILDRVRPREY